MSVVLIDAHHYGEQLRRARRALNMNTTTASLLLKITIRDLRKYELGRAPIQPDLLCALLHRGLALTQCKTRK